MALRFGLMVPQGWRLDLLGIADPIEAYETMPRVAQVAEAEGFDAIWLYDHFHTVPTVTQEATFECWTSTAALARDTKRVRVGQMVTCNSYRNPSLLAKMASTVDVLSHGRLDFGIGAGWYEHEYLAYGYDYLDAPERLRHLREALQVILAKWTEDEAIFEGKYYQVRGAINQPKGVQKPHIPLLIGGSGEKVTLKLVAQYADACNVGHLDGDGLKHKFAVLKQHCDSVGRDYESIKRTTEYICVIGKTEEEAAAKAQSSSSLGHNPSIEQLQKHDLCGTPAMIRRRLAETEEAGVQEVILFLPDAKDVGSIKMFAQECIHQ